MSFVLRRSELLNGVRSHTFGSTFCEIGLSASSNSKSVSHRSYSTADVTRRRRSICLYNEHRTIPHHTRNQFRMRSATDTTHAQHNTTCDDNFSSDFCKGAILVRDVCIGKFASCMTRFFWLRDDVSRPFCFFLKFGWWVMFDLVVL